MNRYAYLATGTMIALLQSLSRIRVITHGRENLPDGSMIFVVNHFTRIETLLLPYHIYQITNAPVWSLADSGLFEGPFGGFLEKVGAVSTRAPDRDRLMVKSLLTGEANWIIFPEGRMVKDKTPAEEPRFFWSKKAGSRPPHTGAATLALRSEFYRQRVRRLAAAWPEEVLRLRELFDIRDFCPVVGGNTWIVPVNITYYPMRAHENLLSRLADRFGRGIPDRLREEALTEGTMFFSGVDIDVRFGDPIDVRKELADPAIEKDMYSIGQINFDDRLSCRPVMRKKAVGLMRRYMADIYGMTTVNHDHLFASLLRAFPFRRITETGLRRRVFLLSAMELHKTGVFRHHSLDSGQIALLTDDRFNKYRDFLLLAEESGVVRREGGWLERDDDAFAPATNLHRARIDNPVGVIANEVTILGELQHWVRRIAWLPGMMVRRRISDYLERYAEQEFEADYRRFCRPGESKDRDVGSPVLLRGRQRDLGVVLVHGFLSAPREVAELAASLNGKGFWVYCLRLKGHGTAPEDLASRTGQDWIESVDIGYAIMSCICRRVVVGGFSFGGGLALDAAARIGNLAGVFSVCPPLLLQDISSRFAPAVTTWNRIMDMINYQGGKLEFVDIRPERPQINYSRLPVASLWEMERFMDNLEEKLPGISTPALVVQADGDPVVDPTGTRRLFNLLGASEKTYRTFPFARHGILAGEGSEAVHAEIGAFLSSLLAESRNRR